jgi:hypothetical protein
LKKDDLLDELLNSLDDKHWETICKLLGREISESKTTRKNLLGKLFKKTIKVSSRKGRGRDLQNWVAEQISILTDTPWGKDEEITSREMGQSGDDVRISPRIRRLFNFCVECKNCETWNLGAFVEQSKRNCLQDSNWIVFLKKNGMEELAVLDARAFFSIMKKVIAK